MGVFNTGTLNPLFVCKNLVFSFCLSIIFSFYCSVASLNSFFVLMFRRVAL